MGDICPVQFEFGCFYLFWVGNVFASVQEAHLRLCVWTVKSTEVSEVSVSPSTFNWFRPVQFRIMLLGVHPRLLILKPNVLMLQTITVSQLTFHLNCIKLFVFNWRESHHGTAKMDSDYQVI